MDKTENALGISWIDSAWVPHLNQGNILDYFSERSNPFYDRTCNNETIKMQRLNPDQMLNMTGLEYSLLHAQEPILYVIRKQHRHSPTQVTPLADYYIIGGSVYQGPDLCSVVNSRLLNTLSCLSSAFDEAQSFARFHPTKGYSWEFKDKEEKEPTSKDKKVKKKEEASSAFQRKRVDLLLGELAKKHPALYSPTSQHPAKAAHAEEMKADVKVEKLPDEKPTSNGSMKPPPEKKQKLR
ncbi:mediator of RNA polymerase ii transcription subunit 6 [Plakobranchus ocellatus]|uniref:Mediator of RNA polymerase II transcription subunit 6 n=1 Tax=Plakobranchus ocellatus TaxID=259542 RepID=A0AAV3YT03_9GAST|nr:mediator of RNA polymerase ii transcription subunit 6 [Plakobranchus ocellatus]